MRLASIVVSVVIGCVLAVQPALAKETAAGTPHKHHIASRPQSAKPAGRSAAGRGKAAHGTVKLAPEAEKAYAAMPEADRRALQFHLAWVGDDDRAAGDDDDAARVIQAIKAFQGRNGAKQTGILSDDQRALLVAAAARRQQAVGWRVIDDAATGARFGVPAALVAQAGASRTGSRWSSGRGQIQIDSFHLTDAALPALFDQEKKTPQRRRIAWSELKPDSFIITGEQGLKEFMVRAQARGHEVRGITVLYDQATAGSMAPAAAAMAYGFDGFPDPNARLLAGQERSVEYGTAIVADSRGDLLTLARLTERCLAITVPGFSHGVRIAADEKSDLALVRLYGARDLISASLAATGVVSDQLTLVGIAGPSAEPGETAVSHLGVRLAAQGLEPTPQPDLPGAAAVDAQGHLVGIVDSAASSDGATPPDILVPAEAVRAFLQGHKIALAAGPSAIERSVVRVICVRK